MKKSFFHGLFLMEIKKEISVQFRIRQKWHENQLKKTSRKKPDCYNEVNVDKKNLCEDKTKIQIGRAQNL